MRLADRISPTDAPPRNFHDIGPDCFGANFPDDFPEIHGHPEVICFRGEWYRPMKLTWRVRLHNWLIRRASGPSDDR